MKMRNGMYLFAAAIVASTVGLSSCSNDEEGVVGGEAQSVANNVTLGVYVNGGVNKKASQADVNLGGAIANISNVVVVPVAGGIYQVPIVFGDLTATKQTAVKKTSLLTTVNEFMVYGNVPTAVLSATSDPFKGFDYKVTSEQKDTKLGDNGFTSELCGPMALIYGEDAKVFSTSTNATEENFWNGATWADDKSVIDPNTNGIKISGVKYQVGVLASKVFENTKFVENEFDLPEGHSVTAENWTTEISAKMNLTGVFVASQATTINEKLEWSGEAWLTDVSPSSGSVTGATHAEGEWSSLAEKIKAVENGATQKVDNADFYTVVAPDKASKIAVSFQFQNNTGYALNLKNGKKVANGDYVYYSVELNQKENKDVFAAATTTILNARITDWGNGTPTPPTSTDLIIGVEFDVNWIAGLSYDFEI